MTLPSHGSFKSTKHPKGTVTRQQFIYSFGQGPRKYVDGDRKGNWGGVDFVLMEN